MQEPSQSREDWQWVPIRTMQHLRINGVSTGITAPREHNRTYDRRIVKSIDRLAKRIESLPALEAAIEAAIRWFEDETFNDLDELSDDAKELLETLRTARALAKGGDS